MKGGSTIYYVFVWLLSWGTGVVSIWNKKDDYARWNGLLCFTGGTYSLSFAIQNLILPEFLQLGLTHPYVRQVLNTASVACLLFYWYMIAYSFLMNTLYFSNLLGASLKKRLSILLLIPPILLYVGSGQYDFVLPVVIEPDNVKWMSAIYITAGCILLFAGYRLDGRRKNPRNLFYVLIYTATIVALYVDLSTIHEVMLREGHIQVDASGSWELHYFGFSSLVLINVVFGIFMGVWGIKLRLEKQKYDSSMKTLSAGAAILNHTIKNEVQKLQYLQERAKHSLESGNKSQVRLLLDEIHSISEHLDGMVKRVKEKAEEISLVETTQPLGEMLNSVLGRLNAADNQKVQIVKSFEADGLLFCDALHVREVIHNLCLNAVEELPDGKGVLE
ncbi:MAG: hypothetical protein ACM32O_14415, partial [Clostridia bacterium]